MIIVIREARLGDSVAIREIERLAGQRFRSVGLDETADDEPVSLDTLTVYANAARSWVAASGRASIPVGYAIVDVVDDCAHLEQISVRPDYQGAGLGRALMDRVATWAKETGRDAVTLTTFSDVPWNRPLYEHLGYRVLPASEIGPELRALRH